MCGIRSLATSARPSFPCTSERAVPFHPVRSASGTLQTLDPSRLWIWLLISSISPVALPCYSLNPCPTPRTPSEVRCVQQKFPCQDPCQLLKETSPDFAFDKAEFKSWLCHSFARCTLSQACSPVCKQALAPTSPSSLPHAAGFQKDPSPPSQGFPPLPLPTQRVPRGPSSPPPASFPPQSSHL